MNSWKATIGINGFTMVFGLANHWYQWFCNGFWSGNHWYQWFFNGFVVQQPLDSMVFQWFPMVANHWSNDGMVTIHRYGLPLTTACTQTTHVHRFKFAVTAEPDLHVLETLVKPTSEVSARIV